MKILLSSGELVHEPMKAVSSMKLFSIAATKEARSSEMSDRGRFVANFMNLL